MFNGFSQAAAAAACVIIMMTFIITSIAIAPNVSRYKTDSNRRAIIAACPMCSASADAANSPATDQGAKTAPKNSPPERTPDPRPTPPSADLAKHTEPEQQHYWRRHKSARSAADRPPRKTRSPRTTPSPGRPAVQTRLCELHTGHATAAPARSSAEVPGGSNDGDQPADLRRLF